MDKNNLHSSMERLKASGGRIKGITVEIFTFQYGEIKSQRELISTQEKIKFTFQYGEIKRFSWS